MTLPSLAESVAEVRDAIARLAPERVQHEKPGFTGDQIRRIREHVAPDHLPDEVLEFLAGPRPWVFGGGTWGLDFMLESYGAYESLSYYWWPVGGVEMAFQAVAQVNPIARHPVLVWAPKGIGVCSPFPSYRTFLLAFAESLRIWNGLGLGEPDSHFLRWWEFLVDPPWPEPDDAPQWDERREPIRAIIAAEDDSPLWPGAPLPWVSAILHDGDFDAHREWLELLRWDTTGEMPAHQLERKRRRDELRAAEVRERRRLSVPDERVEDFRRTLPAGAAGLDDELLRDILMMFAPGLCVDVAVALSELDTLVSQQMSLNVRRTDLESVRANVQFWKRYEAAERRRAAASSDPASPQDDS